MADTPLGLYFEIAADPSKADAAISQFEATTGASFAKMTGAATGAGKSFDTQLTPALERTTAGTQQAHAAAMVLEQQIGVHLPRGITSMLAHSDLIGPALTAAFAPVAIMLFAENIPKLIHGIQDAGDAIGGYGTVAKKAFEESIKANDKALVSFQGLTTEAKIATGQFLILQTNQHLAALEAEKNNAVFSSNFTRYLAMAGAMGVVGLAQAYHGRAQAAINDDVAKQQTLLIKQIDELGKLETKLQDPTEKAAKQTKVWATDLSALSSIYRELRGTLDPVTQAEERLVQILQRIATATGPSYNAALLEKMALEQRDSVVVKAFIADQEKIDQTITKHIPNLHALAIAQTLGGNAQLKLNDAQRAALPLEISETNNLARILQGSRAATDQFSLGELPARKRIEVQIQRQIDMATREIQQYRQLALQHKITTAEMEGDEQQYTQVVESLSLQRQQALAQETLAQAGATIAAGVALVQQLGFRKAAAVVEAVWETAQGIAALARYDFWSAGEHFLSAATDGVIAGQSGGGGMASAVGASVPGGSVGSSAGSSGGSATKTPALAPGAASAAASQSTQPMISQPIVIHIHGDFLSTPNSADVLAKILSDAVEQRDVKLTSRRALLPAYASR
jgi:hypothetical protein